MVKDVTLLVVGVGVGLMLLWSLLASFLSYPALITVIEWSGPAILCIVALAVVLQIGKYFYYKPHSG